MTQSETEANLLKIKALVLKKSLEEAAGIENIDGLEMTFLKVR